MNKDIQDTIDLLSSYTKPEKNILEKTTYINQVKYEPLRNFLREAYKSPRLELRVLACLLNAITTEKKSTFWLSRSTLENLLAQDKHIKNPTKLSGSTYLNIKNELFNGKLIEETRKAGLYNGKKAPGVYRLSAAHLLGMFDASLGHNWRKFIDDNANESWDSIYINNDLDRAKSKQKSREIRDIDTRLLDTRVKSNSAGEVSSLSFKEMNNEGENEGAQSKPTLSTNNSIPESLPDSSIKLDLEVDLSFDEPLNAMTAEASPKPSRQQNHAPIVTKLENRANTQTPPPNDVQDQPSVKAITFQWKRSYGNDLSCATSQNIKTSIPELVQTLVDHGYSSINPTRISEYVFGAKPTSPKLVSWKTSFAELLDQEFEVITSQVKLSQPKPVDPKSDEPILFTPNDFDSDEAYRLWHNDYSRGTVPDSAPSIVEYYNSRALANSYPTMNTDDLERQYAENLKRMQNEEDLPTDHLFKKESN